MIPFRKNLAIAINGGGIKGLIVTQALTVLENHLDFALHASQYAIVHVLDSEQIVYTTSNTSMPHWNPTSALNQPSTSVNHISIECYPTDIMLSVNDQVVDIVFIDQPYTNEGHAAFFLFTYDFVGDQGYQVLIDNVEIYEPVQ